MDDTVWLGLQPGDDWADVSTPETAIAPEGDTVDDVPPPERPMMPAQTHMGMPIRVKFSLKGGGVYIHRPWLDRLRGRRRGRP